MLFPRAADSAVYSGEESADPTLPASTQRLTLDEPMGEEGELADSGDDVSQDDELHRLQGSQPPRPQAPQPAPRKLPVPQPPSAPEIDISAIIQRSIDAAMSTQASQLTNIASRLQMLEQHRAPAPQLPPRPSQPHDDLSAATLPACTANNP